MKAALFTKATFVVRGLILAFVLSLAATGTKAAQFNLFVEQAADQAVAGSEPHKEGLFKAATRMRKVTLSPQAATTEGLVIGDTLQLALFSNMVVTATIDRVATDLAGTKIVRARMEKYPMGYVLITTNKGRSLVTIKIPELSKDYTINYDVATQAHFLLELDPAKIDRLEESPARIPPQSGKQESELVPSPAKMNQGVNDPATLDVMIVYTPAARNWADSNGGGIAQVIAQAVEAAQLVMDNSSTLVTLRLVHSQEVNYSESGDTNSDLDRLTETGDGYLDEVHTWRNTYSADVVAMFTMTEGTGGLGWILNDTAGAPGYAFSINRVQQVTSGYTYVHEMGHNLGLGHHKQQNVEPGPGLYSYSAGWRWTGNDGNPYSSVMSYSSGSYFADGIGATEVAYFSNPNTTYQGVATGHAQDGDNARNVREIKHVIAAYKKSNSSTRSTIDFNGDGKPDILWSHRYNGQNYVWYMNGITKIGGGYLNYFENTNWGAVGVGDFNGDGRPDILLRNRATGENFVSYMNGAAVIGGEYLQTITDPNWVITGVGDFNANGMPDILWSNIATGQNRIWYMTGTTQAGAEDLPSIADRNWAMVGVGDFNGDGKPDILWRHRSSGQNYVWYMNGAQRSGGSYLQIVATLDWEVGDVDDFNADGKPDILWRNKASGDNYLWYMDGVTKTGGAYLPWADPNWKIVNQ